MGHALCVCFAGCVLPTSLCACARDVNMGEAMRGCVTTCDSGVIITGRDVCSYMLVLAMHDRVYARPRVRSSMHYLSRACPLETKHARCCPTHYHSSKAHDSGLTYIKGSS